MSNNTYNGWTNRETWLINVWFEPETKDQLECIKDQLESDIDQLPDYLKDFINADCINWEELGKHVSQDDETDE